MKRILPFLAAAFFMSHNISGAQMPYEESENYPEELSEATSVSHEFDDLEEDTDIIEEDQLESPSQEEAEEEKGLVSYSSSGPIPMQMVTSEILYITSKDGRIFRKLKHGSWMTVRSLQAMKVGYITEIEVKILHGHHMHFGFTKETGKSASLRGMWHPGYSYGTGLHQRCTSGVCTNEIQNSLPGDILRLKIDLRQGQQYFQVFRNNGPLGIFFQGLDLNVPLYFASSLGNVGHSFEILSKKEYKQ